MDLRQFSNFFNEYRQKFIRFAYMYVADSMAAEDIVSESFTYYWNNKDRLPADANVPAYVLTAVKHRCIDYLRHEQVCQDTSNELYQLYSWELSTRIATLENFEPADIFTSEIQKFMNTSTGGCCLFLVRIGRCQYLHRIEQLPLFVQQITVCVRKFGPLFYFLHFFYRCASFEKAV